jgi:ribosomal protein RSM22 (predicted rRNA methylase)
VVGRGRASRTAKSGRFDRRPEALPRVQSVHAGLVGERALVGKRYLADPALRAEYGRDIAPRTRAALERIFAELPATTVVRRALDLGAGTGAAGEAIRRRFGAVELVAVDQVPGPGIVVADLRREVRPSGVEGTFDLVVAAHLLNELGRSLSVGERAKLVFAWARELLAEGGLLVLLEPALRETSRELLAVRDQLVSVGYFVLAPCLWQGPCPALVRERDFCHATAPWEPDEAARRAGRSAVDYSYLVLARGGERSTDRRLFRVVSDPLEEKGRLRLFGCGPAGRHALVRLHRDRDLASRGFDEARRGDLIVVGAVERAGDGLRIPAGARVERR